MNPIPTLNRKARRAAKFAGAAVSAALLESERRSSELLHSLLGNPFVQQGHRVNFAMSDEDATRVIKMGERRLLKVHKVGFLKVVGGVQYGVRISRPDVLVGTLSMGAVEPLRLVA